MEPLEQVESVTAWQSGGGIVLDLVRLKDGSILAISDESVVLYANEEELVAGDAVERPHNQPCTCNRLDFALAACFLVHGLNPMENDETLMNEIDAELDSLTAEYQAWQRQQGLKLGSADEHLFDENLTEAQRVWLQAFSRRWEGASPVHTASGVTRQRDL